MKRRPAASEIAEMLARYVARTRIQLGGPRPPAVQESPTETVPLTPPPAVTGGSPPALRLPRFGAARRESEARLVRLREPLPHSKRLPLIGAHHYSGRATTTMVLGPLLAAVRREPVLALDGSASEGALDAFLTHRNPAVVRDLAALPPPPSYEKMSASRTPSGLKLTIC